MRRPALLAVLLPLLAAAPAEAKVSCGDGVPMFADGKLRLFGVPFRSRDEWGPAPYPLTLYFTSVVFWPIMLLVRLGGGK